MKGMKLQIIRTILLTVWREISDIAAFVGGFPVLAVFHS
jgi:hypothetical protein